MPPKHREPEGILQVRILAPEAADVRVVGGNRVIKVKAGTGVAEARLPVGIYSFRACLDNAVVDSAEAGPVNVTIHPNRVSAVKYTVNKGNFWSSGTLQRSKAVRSPAERALIESLLQNAKGQLNTLVGLDEVKKEVDRLEAGLRFREAWVRAFRRGPGKSVNHLVFTGKPGTGKTTIARILGHLFKAYGVLRSGHTVEVDKEKLTGAYVGQTAKAVKKKLDEAMDGVLFIDEAYTLAEGGPIDYGKEAIRILLKRMDDDRDRLVVIVAGYQEEMAHFISSNPGLRSRFPRYIHFPDYTVPQLVQIYESMCRQNGFTTDKGIKGPLRSLFGPLVKASDFSNGRDVRNVYERSVSNLAYRLMSGETKKWSKEVLRQIEAVDVPRTLSRLRTPGCE